MYLKLAVWAILAIYSSPYKFYLFIFVSNLEGVFIVLINVVCGRFGDVICLFIFYYPASKRFFLVSFLACRKLFLSLVFRVVVFFV